MEPPGCTPVADKGAMKLLQSPRKEITQTLESIHRMNFMKVAYGIDLDHVAALDEDAFEGEALTAAELASSKRGIGTKRLSPAKYKRRIHALLHWHTGDKEFKTPAQFRSAYNDCKNLKKLGFLLTKTMKVITFCGKLTLKMTPSPDSVSCTFLKLSISSESSMLEHLTMVPIRPRIT